MPGHCGTALVDGFCITCIAGSTEPQEIGGDNDVETQIPECRVEATACGAELRERLPSQRPRRSSGVARGAGGVSAPGEHSLSAMEHGYPGRLEGIWALES